MAWSERQSPHQSAMAWSKLATPELPVLEGAAHELAALREFDLLPAAAVDLGEKPEQETDTPVTRAPPTPDSPDADNENTSEEDYEEDELEKAQYRWPEVMSPERQLLVDKHGFILGTQEKDEEEASSRTRASSAPPRTRELPALEEQPQPAEEQPVPPTGMYAPWRCRFEQDEWGTQHIVPVSNGRVPEHELKSLRLPKGGDNDMILWVFLQPDDGKVLVVPCTTTTMGADCPSQALLMAAASPASSCTTASPASCTSAASTACTTAPFGAASPAAGTAASPLLSARRHPCQLTALPEEEADEFAPALPPPGSYMPVWAPGSEHARDVLPTTIVLRNLPAELERDDLLEVLDREEFSGFYDFVVLPSDAPSASGHRVAVVNLTHHKYGLSLAARLHGKAAWGEGIGDGVTKCEAHWYNTAQGLDALLQRYQDLAADESIVPEEMQPIYLSGGFQARLPTSAD
mmetsp:Transcript_17093/g.43980  ORF Transcript_17093/g.43980 Transcript_17093/m.43980 type:complete len:463 (+) Transcript_17093:143-1531(+)